MPLDDTDYNISKEEQALRWADDFFDSPEKWWQASGGQRDNTQCLAQAIAAGMHYTKTVKWPSIHDINVITGLEETIPWNDDKTTTFADVKELIKRRIRHYENQRCVVSA